MRMKDFQLKSLTSRRLIVIELVCRFISCLEVAFPQDFPLLVYSRLVSLNLFPVSVAKYSCCDLFRCIRFSYPFPETYSCCITRFPRLYSMCTRIDMEIDREAGYFL